MSSSNISERNSYQSCCLMRDLEVYFGMLLQESHRTRLGNTKVMHSNCCKRNENMFLIQTGSPVDLVPQFCFNPRLFFQYFYHFLLAEDSEIIPTTNSHEQLYQDIMHRMDECTFIFLTEIFLRIRKTDRCITSEASIEWSFKIHWVLICRAMSMNTAKHQP